MDPELKKLQDQIDILNTKINKLTGEFDSLDKSIGDVNKSIGAGNDLLVDAVTSTLNIQKNFSKFALDSKAQYKYAEKLAESSKATAVNIGISVGRSDDFTKSFNKAAAQLQKFGMDAGDVNRIMTEFGENSGRSRIITPEETLNIGLMSKGLGVGVENASKLMEGMDQMGMNAEKASKYINEMVVDSQNLGLNSSKVGKVLSNNFGAMSNMSFNGGVKGMTQMAKLAVQMKMDVGTMLSMADKFYEPEAAIEAAANLQMMGGDIAEAFGDPFETMYLARNKPEELAAKVKTMTENMIQFNDETGQYEFPAEARMQLKYAGEQLGINVDQMMDIAKQSSKIKDIKMKVSSNIVDDDMREGLASLARLDESGNWVIDIAGQKEPLELADVGMTEAAEIMSAPKDSDEAIMDMAYNSMTTNQILTNIEESLKTGLVANSNVYQITEDVLRPSMRGMFEGVESQVENMITAIKDTPFGNFRENMVNQAEELGIASGKGLEKIFEENMTEGLTEAIEKLPDLFKSNLSEIIAKFNSRDIQIDASDRVRNEAPVAPVYGQDMVSLPGSGSRVLTGEFGSLSLDDRDLIAAGDPKKLTGGGSNGKSVGKMELGGTATININIKSDNPSLDISSLKDTIGKEVMTILNNGKRHGGRKSKGYMEEISI